MPVFVLREFGVQSPNIQLHDERELIRPFRKYGCASISHLEYFEINMPMDSYTQRPFGCVTVHANSFIHSLQVTIKTKLLSFLFVVVRRGCWWQTWGSGADQNRTAGVVQLHVAVQHVQPRGGPRSGRGQPQDGHGGLLPRLVHHGSRHRSFERISHRLRAQGFAGFSAGVHGETVKNIVS